MVHSLSEARRLPEHANMASPTILCLILITGYALASAQANLTQLKNLSQDRVWRGRISSVDTNSPVARYFHQNQDASNAIGPVFDYIEALWKVVETRREKNDARACNLYKTIRGDWPFRMISRLQVFQVGLVEQSCFSKVNLRTAISNGELSPTTSNDLPKLFSESKRLTNEAFHNVRLVPDGNWSLNGKPYNMTYLTLVRSGQTCTVDNIFAYHVKGVWYLRAIVTNAPISESKTDYQRQFMQEFIPRNGTTSLRMVFPNIKTGQLEQATTIVERWRSTGYTIERESFDDPLSPLALVYQQNLVAVDLASDAITISNVAILALPMAMNLIPLAFLADAHAFGMFIYILVTDVFSTIPIFIKGVELIRSSQPTKNEAFAFFAGDTDMGCMQSWVVQCKGEGKFRNVGIVFVVVSLSATVVGVALELWAKRYMYWKRAAAKDGSEISGPFGKVALDYDFDDMSFADIENMLGDEYDYMPGQSRGGLTVARTRKYVLRSRE